MTDGNGTKPEDTANSFENSISKSKAEWLKPYHWQKGQRGICRTRLSKGRLLSRG